MGKHFRLKLASLALTLLTAAIVSAPACGKTRISTEKFSHYGNCYKLSNGTVEVFITKEMGPRIIGYRFVGEENILAELPLDATTTTKLGVWRTIGGHRLWAAPESIPNTYYPDNNPVKMVKLNACTIRVIPPAEKKIGIQKSMVIRLDPKGTKVTVTHEIKNVGKRPVKLAPWALSALRPGGTIIIPQEPYIPHSKKLLPARQMILWNYTDLTDSRLRLGKKYVCLSTDTSKKWPTKLGVANSREWAAYYCQGTLYINRFDYNSTREYPDMGSNCETYTDSDYIEMETLGALINLKPGKTAKHKETWYLFKDVTIGDTDASLDAAIKPLVAKAKK